MIEFTAAIPAEVKAARNRLSYMLLPRGDMITAHALGAEPASPKASDNVVGVAIGAADDGFFVDVLVKRQFAANDIPPALLLPQSYGGQRVRVTEVGSLLPQSSPGRALQPGCGLGPIDRPEAAGTLGAIVRDDEHHYVLSNNHVLAAADDLLAGARIVQPGPRAGGGEDDVIATLSFAVPLDPAFPVDVDCAIAELHAGVGWTHEIGTPIEPDLGMLVEKTGSTSGRTFGRISRIAADIPMPYGPSKVVLLSNQMLIRPTDEFAFSQGGDSGAAVLDTEGRAVGLLVGGNAKVTVACQFGLVLAELGRLKRGAGALRLAATKPM